VRPESQRSAHSVRHLLAALDYQETVSFSFVEARWEHELAGNADPIRVLNPIAAPLSVMRSSLIGSLVATLRHNLARRAPRVRVFEIGRTYRRDAAVADGDVAVAGIDQPLRVSGLAWGPADGMQWGVPERAIDFFDVKGDVLALLQPLQARFVAGEHPALHPGRCASVEVSGRRIGWVGELHPRWCQAYEIAQPPVLFELDLAAVLSRPVPAASALPRQQSAWRDLALVVAEGVTHDALMSALLDDSAGLVRAATLFDVYRPKAGAEGWGEGERSLAVRIELRDDSATLTEERIGVAMDAAVDRARRQVGARLRT
jgi:phenylalanyl-tRNA synthetase beta chain